MQRLEITNLIFGGGGTKGGALPGAMEIVEAQVPRKQIINCAGTSIGAIYATLYSYGKANADIRQMFAQKKLSDFISGLSEHGEKKLMAGLNKANNRQPFFAAKTLKGGKGELKSNLKKHLGVSDNVALMSWLSEEGFNELGIKNVTFKDLKTKHDENPEKYKLLYVVVTNLSTGREVVLSHENAPNVLIASASCASAAFPGAFQPTTLWIRKDDGTIEKDLDGHKYADGGLSWNCALTLFDEARFIDASNPRDRTPIINPHSLAMRFVDASQKDYYNFGGDIPVRQIDNLIELISTVMLATFIQQETALDTPENRARTIQIDSVGVSTFEVQLNGNKLNALVSSGKVAAQQFFGLISRDQALQELIKLRQVVKEIREDDKISCSIL